MSFLLFEGLPVGGWIGIIVGVAVAAFAGGFFLARFLIKKQLRDNPPISEKQIRAMYASMGKKPTEKQIRATMNAIKNSN
ncbi:MAG: YneF family protein [Bacilli bacterium]|nr:YneF family protein [Bacilli bacterium]